MTSKPAAADQAFRELYLEHYDFVWRSARRLGVPEESVDDTCQEVFVVVARRLEDFEGRSQFRTWLFSIVVRVARTKRRTDARRQRRHDAFAAEASDRAHVPQERVDQQDLLIHFLAELDEDKRLVFVLMELEGMTAREVAEGFGVNANTVATRLRAARKELRAIAVRHLEHTQPTRGAA